MMETKLSLGNQEKGHLILILLVKSGKYQQDLECQALQTLQVVEANEGV